MRMILIAIIALGAAPSFAQVEGQGGESPSRSHSLHLHAGRLLPFGIFGVRSIYPYWGLRFAHPWAGQDWEWSTTFTQAHDVKFYGGSLSLAFPTQLEGFQFVPTIGVALSYYSGRTNLRRLPFALVAGVNFGFSPILPITDQLAVRTDFMFGFNPGRTLYVGSGLQFSF